MTFLFSVAHRGRLARGLRDVRQRVTMQFAAPVFLFALLAFASAAQAQTAGCSGAVCNVTLSADPGTSASGTTGAAGTLSYAIAYANAQATPVTINISVATITLSGPLSPILQSVTINGESAGTPTSITSSTSRIFFAGTDTASEIGGQRQTVALNNLSLSGTATGGAGVQGGGGGLGAGGGIFVAPSADVTLSGVSFAGNHATGGAGATGAGGGGGGLGGAGGTNVGGGGGLYGSGGTGSFIIGDSGGGGGGVFGHGGDGTTGSGGGGGYSGAGGAGSDFGVGGSGGANPLSVNGRSGNGGNGGGSPGGSNGGGGGGSSGDFPGGGGGGGFGGGGAGGFGGGGGGGSGVSGGNGGFGGGGGGGGSAGGGAGGFGGGGGGSTNTNNAGAGGYGGGGGSGTGNPGGNGGGGGFGGGGGAGTTSAGVSGFGAGAASGAQGGGGAALGGAVYVAAGGTLTIDGTSSEAGSQLTGGTGANAGATYGSGFFFQGTAGGTTTLTYGAGTQSVGGVIADYTGSGGTNPAAGTNTADQGGSVGLTKNGTGTLTLSANNTYTGATAVSAGTLEVDGSVASSSGTTVSGTGTLSGTGTVSATSVTAGTLAPGNAGAPTGTLHVNTSLTFQTAAAYMITISGTTNSSTTVTGTAAPAGASVTIAPGSTVVANHTYVILTATTLTGAFNPTVTYGAYQGTVSNAGNNVDLTFTFTGPNSIPTTGLNPNQAAIANALNGYLAGGGTLPPNFVTLFGLTGPQLAQALSELDGEAGTGAATGTFQFVNDFFNLLSDIAQGTGGGGGGANGGGASGFAAEATNDALPDDVALAYRHALKQNPPPSAAPQNFERRWTAWGSGFGGGATYDGNATVGSNNLTASDYGYAGGMDYHAAANLKLGFALAGGGTNWSLAQNLGSGRSDVFQAAGYGIEHFGSLYLTAMAAFGESWFTTNRIAALGDQLRASFNGQDYALRGEAGYRYAVAPTIGLTPYAAIQTQWLHTPGYAETDLTGGGFALSYAAQNATDTRSELGARADDLTMFGTMPLVLRARLAWAHDWVSGAALTPTFQALPGASFVVNGAAVPQNSALVSAGGQLFLTSNWSVEAKFNGEFASSAQTYAGSGTLRYAW